MDKRRIEPRQILARLGKVIGGVAVCAALAHLYVRAQHAVSTDKALAYDTHGRVVHVEPTMGNYTWNNGWELFVDHFAAVIALGVCLLAAIVIAGGLDRVAKYIVLGDSRAKW